MELAGIAAGVLLLLAALLTVPVELRLDFAREARPRLELRIAWLFGWVRREIRGGRGERKPSTAPPIRALVRAWQDGLDRSATRLARSLRRYVTVHEMRVRARFGLGDPADTGMLLGLIAPLSAAARASLPALDLRLEPDFDGLILDGELHAALRFRPLRALPHLATFALSPATLRAMRMVRSQPK